MNTALIHDPWIPFRRPNPLARLRLFCFPYAGGGASAFCAWAGGLPGGIEVCPVQLPGREHRFQEPPFTCLEPLIEALAGALIPYLDLPFGFFGHSMGGLIAFELARRLRKKKGPCPAHLFVSGRRAPQVPDDDEPFYTLPDPEFVTKLRQLNGTPEEVFRNANLMDFLLPTLKADFAVCETYVHRDEAPLDCPISIFGGLEDADVTRDELAVWRCHTRGRFRLRMLPGNHFFIHSSRSLLLRAVAEDLTLLKLQPNGRVAR